MNEEINAYLDALRESGLVNMLGAAPLLQEKFGFSRNEAKLALLDWIRRTNNQRDPS